MKGASVGKVHREKRAVREHRCVDEIVTIIRAKYPHAEFFVTKKPGLVRGPWIEVFVPADNDVTLDIHTLIS